MTDQENEPRLSDDSSPNTALCQNCDEEFDWQRDSCPHCGWDKSEWVAAGRYGLAK